MNKERKYHKGLIVKVALIFLVSIFFPTLVRASDFFFDSASKSINQGDTFIVELKLSTPDNFINAVEGYLSFDNNKLEIKEVSVGGSIFNLWAKPVAYSNETGKVSFVGGVAGGFQGKDAEILKIIFFAKKEGAADLSFNQNSLLFLNDGEGTKVAFGSRPFTLSILKRPANVLPKDEWQPFLEEDKNPPEPFEINIGSNPSMFGGKYFVSFFTTDKESGVDHYEIREGDGILIKTESPYLLKDQDLRSVITVKTVDKAGNERIVELAPTYPSKPFYKTIGFIGGVIILGIIVLLVIFWRFIKPILNKKQNEKRY